METRSKQIYKLLVKKIKQKSNANCSEKNQNKASTSYPPELGQRNEKEPIAQKKTKKLDFNMSNTKQLDLPYCSTVLELSSWSSTWKKCFRR